MKIGRNGLNKPIAPYNLYVDISTHGDERERTIQVIVLHGEPIGTADEKLQEQLKHQILPHLYKWKQLRRSWLAGFLKNKDGTYHTIVGMPVEEIKGSTLSLYIVDANKDGVRDDLTIEIDLSDMDWSPTRSWVRQSTLSR